MYLGLREQLLLKQLSVRKRNLLSLFRWHYFELAGHYKATKDVVVQSFYPEKQP
jgi:hypothetical protein